MTARATYLYEDLDDRDSVLVVVRQGGTVAPWAIWRGEPETSLSCVDTGIPMVTSSDDSTWQIPFVEGHLELVFSDRRVAPDAFVEGRQLAPVADAEIDVTDGSVVVHRGIRQPYPRGAGPAWMRHPRLPESEVDNHSIELQQIDGKYVRPINVGKRVQQLARSPYAQMLAREACADLANAGNLTVNSKYFTAVREMAGLLKIGVEAKAIDALPRPELWFLAEEVLLGVAADLPGAPPEFAGALESAQVAADDAFAPSSDLDAGRTTPDVGGLAG